MGVRYPRSFISRFQAELDRLFQEALQIGESQIPAGEWQPSRRHRRDADLSRGHLIEMPGMTAERPPGRGQGHPGDALRHQVDAAAPQLESPAAQVPVHANAATAASAARSSCSRPRQHPPGYGTARPTGCSTLEFPKIQDKRHDGSDLAYRGGSGRTTMSKTPAEPQDEAIKIPDVLPVLPLKDMVIFPYIILPLSVGAGQVHQGGRPRARREPDDHAGRPARRRRTTTPARTTSTRWAPRRSSCGC